MDLRFGLWKNSVNLSGINCDLGKILDEIAPNGCVSPKFFIKDVRVHMTLVIRFAGVRAKKVITMIHEGSNDIFNLMTFNVNRKEINHKLMAPFWDCDNIQQTYNNGVSALKKWNLPLLHHLCESLLDCSLDDTSLDDFTIANSFLNNIMRVAGYGKAFKYSSAPRSGPKMKTDKHGLADEVYTVLGSMKAKAESGEFTRTTGDDWEQKCSGYWKSTSAGVAPEKVEIKIDNNLQKVSVRKKLGIAMALGKKAFSRTLLSRKLNLQNPGSVGYRDVPYKPTRAIYVLPLGTLHAQVAVIQHLVNYVGTPGSLQSRATTVMIDGISFHYWKFVNFRCLSF